MRCTIGPLIPAIAQRVFGRGQRLATLRRAAVVDPHARGIGLRLGHQFDLVPCVQIDVVEVQVTGIIQVAGDRLVSFDRPAVIRIILRVEFSAAAEGDVLRAVRQGAHLQHRGKVVGRGEGEGRCGLAARFGPAQRVTPEVARHGSEPGAAAQVDFNLRTGWLLQYEEAGMTAVIQHELVLGRALLELPAPVAQPAGVLARDQAGDPRDQIGGRGDHGKRAPLDAGDADHLAAVRNQHATALPAEEPGVGLQVGLPNLIPLALPRDHAASKGGLRLFLHLARITDQVDVAADGQALPVSKRQRREPGLHRAEHRQIGEQVPVDHGDILMLGAIGEDDARLGVGPHHVRVGHQVAAVDQKAAAAAVRQIDERDGRRNGGEHLRRGQRAGRERRHGGDDGGRGCSGCGCTDRRRIRRLGWWRDTGGHRRDRNQTQPGTD